MNEKPARSPSPFGIQSSRAGMSLMEIIVAIGLFSVVVLIFTGVLTNSHREAAAIREKLALLELQRTLIGSATGINFCAHEFGLNPVNFTFPTTSFPPGGFTLPIQTLAMDAAGDQPIAKVGEPLSSALRVSSIVFSDFIPRGTADYVATLTIATTGGVRPLRPVVASINVRSAVDATGTNLTLTGCNTYGGALGGGIDTEEHCLALGGDLGDAGCSASRFLCIRYGSLGMVLSFLPGRLWA